MTIATTRQIETALDLSAKRTRKREFQAHEVWNERAAILDAIARGDAKGAPRAINAHVTTAHSRVAALLTDKSRSTA